MLLRRGRWGFIGACNEGQASRGGKSIPGRARERPCGVKEASASGDWRSHLGLVRLGWGGAGLDAQPVRLNVGMHRGRNCGPCMVFSAHCRHCHI